MVTLALVVRAVANDEAKLHEPIARRNERLARHSNPVRDLSLVRRDVAFVVRELHEALVQPSLVFVQLIK